MDEDEGIATRYRAENKREYLIYGTSLEDGGPVRLHSGHLKAQDIEKPIVTTMSPALQSSVEHSSCTSSLALYRSNFQQRNGGIISVVFPVEPFPVCLTSSSAPSLDSRPVASDNLSALQHYPRPDPAPAKTASTSGPSVCVLISLEETV